jgi:hypothetical protein
MSKGFGVVQRRLVEIFQKTDRSYTVGELCGLVYGVGKAEMRHRVAAHRALVGVLQRYSWIGVNDKGSPYYFYDCRNPQACHHAEMRRDKVLLTPKDEQRTLARWCKQEAIREFQR